MGYCFLPSWPEYTDTTVGQDFELSLFFLCHKKKNKSPGQNLEFNTEDQLLSVFLFDLLRRVNFVSVLVYYKYSAFHLFQEFPWNLRSLEF